MSLESWARLVPRFRGQPLGLSVASLPPGLRKDRHGSARPEKTHPVRRAQGSRTLIAEAQCKDASSYRTSEKESPGPSEPMPPLEAELQGKSQWAPYTDSS